jgi:hypothetical protein
MDRLNNRIGDLIVWAVLLGAPFWLPLMAANANTTT